MKRNQFLKFVQKLTFFGFELDSTKMEVSLTEGKKEKFSSVAVFTLSTLPRVVAGLIGMMVAYAPAVE